MIERYLSYLSAIRRYSPRTVEIYRGVLEDFLAFALPDDAVEPEMDEHAESQVDKFLL